MRVGINLLWVRPGKNGGTESYIRNILDGLLKSSRGIQYYLYVSKDNESSFDTYYKNKHFIKRLCPIDTSSQVKRVLWENLNLDKVGKKDDLNIWFIPVYSKPFLTSKKISYITVIHDIQAIHYPEYFSWFRNMFFKLCWKNACKTSDVVITISNFCKNDILKNLKVDKDKVKVIYNPIITQNSTMDFSVLQKKYDIRDRDFYYTVSALAKHKNIMTLLSMMKKLKMQGSNKKLLITGVKVNADSEVTQYIKENNLEQNVILTGYISNEERDCLYDHCEVFLFPSVFEGFGMPPIEALQRGTPVVTTKETSLYEVTKGKAYYVENPFNEEEWINNIQLAKVKEWEETMFLEYSVKNIIEQYENLFEDIAKRVAK